MLKNLVKIASDLDKAGFKKEADIVDLIIKRVASVENEVDDEVEKISEEDVPFTLTSDEEQELYEMLIGEEEEEWEPPSDGDLEDRGL